MEENKCFVFHLGCIITHKNFLCAMFGCARAFDIYSLAQNGIPRAMNFLPLAHMFGLGTVLSITYLGKFSQIAH